MTTHSPPVEGVRHFDWRCRLCDGDRLIEFLSFGKAPIADRLVRQDQLQQQEPTVALKVLYCPDCALVQIADTVDPAILFGDAFSYLSSYSDTLVEDGRMNAAELIRRRSLDASSLVVEVGSNDGYLLKNFHDHGIGVLGIDPAPIPATAANKAGISTRRIFFSSETARRMADEGLRADIVIANNVLAHNPEVRDFVQGLTLILKPQGMAVIEVPWVFCMMKNMAYDTIYHQHVFYFSLTAVAALLGRHGLFVNSIQRLDSQGGSLRLHISRRPKGDASVDDILTQERSLGVFDSSVYLDFGRRVHDHSRRLHDLVTDLKADNKRIAAYGASAKGTSLLHACDLNNSVLDYVVDRNTAKQGRYMPVSRLPIRAPETLIQDRPDYVLLLSWNLAGEIVAQQSRYLEGGGKFIVPIPEPHIVDASPGSNGGLQPHRLR